MAGGHVPDLAMGWRRCQPYRMGQLKKLSLEEDQGEPSV